MLPQRYCSPIKVLISRHKSNGLPDLSKTDPKSSPNSELCSKKVSIPLPPFSLMKSASQSTKLKAKLKVTPNVLPQTHIPGVQARLNFFLTNTASTLQPRQARKQDNIDEQVRWEPLGTIGNISAWNYPYFVGCNVFIPGLLTGNAIVYKPSEYAAMTGLNIASLLHKSGVPKDVFVPIIGNGPDAGNAIVANKNINGMFFTGSFKTGQLIYKVFNSNVTVK
jgi:hypothetical protein